MMYNLNFKEYLEGIYGLNAPGRAGEHVWKPDSPEIYAPGVPRLKQQLGTKHVKGVRLDTKQDYRPLQIPPFRAMSGNKFGIQVKRSPKPSEK